jgi:ribosomal protein S18 acetylase RimI-like enzyme
MRALGAQIRPARGEELDAVLALWALSDAAPTVTERRQHLELLLSTDSQALLVAEVEDALAGALIAAWNGWRGSFYRLAVHPEQRRRGLGTRLVRAGEQLLRRRGAVRLDALVGTDDHQAIAFWRAAGYELQD